MTKGDQLKKIDKAIKMLHEVKEALINEPVSFIDPPTPKTDVHIDIEKFIQLKLGCFQHDIVSATEVEQTMTDPAHEQHRTAHVGRFRRNRIGQTLRKVGLNYPVLMTGQRGQGNQRGWVIRHYDRYRNISSASLFSEYHLQRTKI